VVDKFFFVRRGASIALIQLANKRALAEAFRNGLGFLSIDERAHMRANVWGRIVNVAGGHRRMAAEFARAFMILKKNLFPSHSREMGGPDSLHASPSQQKC
jgi:hypothetical protein